NADDDKYNSLLYVSMDRYPVFRDYTELLETAKKIDYKKASDELMLLVSRLKDTLPYSKYSELSAKTAGFTNVEELSFRLSNLAAQYPINVNPQSDLAKLMKYVSAGRLINPLELITEERRITEDLRTAFSKDATETDIAFLNDFYFYLESFFNTKITADDYEYFKSEYGRFASVYAKYAYTNHLAGLQKDIDFINEYYSVNEDRNKIFMEKISGGLASSGLSAGGLASSGLAAGGIAAENNKAGKAGLVVVITGGFHSGGLNRLFKQNGISYVSIMPSVTKETKTAELNYEKYVRGEALFDRFTASAPASSAQPLLNSPFVKEPALSEGTSSRSRMGVAGDNVSGRGISVSNPVQNSSGQNSLALGLASQAGSAEIAQMMIQYASKKLKESGLEYNKENIAFLIEMIREMTGDTIGEKDIKYTDSDTYIKLSNGFEIKLIKNKKGKIENSTNVTVNAEAIETNKAKFTSESAVRAAVAAAEAASKYDIIFNPRVSEIVENFMLLAAKNELVSGNGLVFNIQTDPSFREAISKDEEFIARIPDNVQDSKYLAYERDSAANSEERILARIFLASYYALGYDKAVLGKVIPQNEDMLSDIPELSNFSKPANTDAIIEQLRADVNEDKKASIVFVCIGNFNRSAAADVLFKQFLRDNGKKNIDVFSAGIKRGYKGRELSHKLKNILQETGKVDDDILDGFRSERIRDLLYELKKDNKVPDYIVTVSEEQRQFLLRLAGKSGINLNIVLFSELSPGLPELADGRMPDPAAQEISPRGLIDLIDKIFAENFTSNEKPAAAQQSEKTVVTEEQEEHSFTEDVSVGENVSYSVKGSIEEERSLEGIDPAIIEKARKATFKLFLSAFPEEPRVTASLVEFDIGVEKRKYLMAAYHTVRLPIENNEDVQFLDKNGNKISTKVVLHSQSLDVAFLEVPEEINDVEPLKVSLSPAAKGERLFYLGYPSNQEVMSGGYVQDEDGYKGILTTLAIGDIDTGGTCGAAILNMKGEVIGIRRNRTKNETLAKLLNVSADEFFGCEAPINTMIEFLKDQDSARGIYFESEGKKVKVFDMSYGENITNTEYSYTTGAGILQEVNPAAVEKRKGLTVYGNMGGVSRFFKDPAYKTGEIVLTIQDRNGSTRTVTIKTEGKKVVSVNETKTEDLIIQRLKASGIERFDISMFEEYNPAGHKIAENAQKAALAAIGNNNVLAITFKREAGETSERYYERIMRSIEDFAEAVETGSPSLKNGKWFSVREFLTDAFSHGNNLDGERYAYIHIADAKRKVTVINEYRGDFDEETEEAKLAKEAGIFGKGMGREYLKTFGELSYGIESLSKGKSIFESVYVIGDMFPRFKRFSNKVPKPELDKTAAPQAVKENLSKAPTEDLIVQSLSDNKLELPWAGRFADWLHLKADGSALQKILRAAVVSISEFFHSLAPYFFVKMHGPMSKKSFISRTIGHAFILAATAAGITLAIYLHLAFPAAFFLTLALNVATHTIYNLSVPEDKRLELGQNEAAFNIDADYLRDLLRELEKNDRALYIKVVRLMGSAMNGSSVYVDGNLNELSDNTEVAILWDSKGYSRITPQRIEEYAKSVGNESKNTLVSLIKASETGATKETPSEVFKKLKSEAPIITGKEIENSIAALEQKLIGLGIKNIPEFAVRSLPQKYYKTNQNDPYGTEISEKGIDAAATEAFMVGIDPKGFAEDMEFEMNWDIASVYGPDINNMFVKMLKNTFLALVFGTEVNYADISLKDTPVFIAFNKGDYLVNILYEADSKTKYSLSDISAINITDKEKIRRWYSQAKGSTENGEMFAVKLSQAELEMLIRSVDRFIENELFPYLKSRNLILDRDYYFKIAFPRYINNYLYMKYLEKLVENTEKNIRDAESLGNSAGGKFGFGNKQINMEILKNALMRLKKIDDTYYMQAKDLVAKVIYNDASYNWEKEKKNNIFFELLTPKNIRDTAKAYGIYDINIVNLVAELAELAKSSGKMSEDEIFSKFERAKGESKIFRGVYMGIDKNGNMRFDTEEERLRYMESIAREFKFWQPEYDETEINWMRAQLDARARGEEVLTHEMKEARETLALESAPAFNSKIGFAKENAIKKAFGEVYTSYIRMPLPYNAELRMYKRKEYTDKRTEYFAVEIVDKADGKSLIDEKNDANKSYIYAEGVKHELSLYHFAKEIVPNAIDAAFRKHTEKLLIQAQFDLSLAASLAERFGSKGSGSTTAMILPENIMPKINDAGLELKWSSRLADRIVLKSDGNLAQMILRAVFIAVVESPVSILPYLFARMHYGRAGPAESQKSDFRSRLFGNFLIIFFTLSGAAISIAFSLQGPLSFILPLMLNITTHAVYNFYVYKKAQSEAAQSAANKKREQDLVFGERINNSLKARMKRYDDLLLKKEDFIEKFAISGAEFDKVSNIISGKNKKTAAEFLRKSNNINAGLFVFFHFADDSDFLQQILEENNIDIRIRLYAYAKAKSEGISVSKTSFDGIASQVSGLIKSKMIAAKDGSNEAEINAFLEDELFRDEIFASYHAAVLLNLLKVRPDKQANDSLFNDLLKTRISKAYSRPGCDDFIYGESSLKDNKSFANTAAHEFGHKLLHMLGFRVHEGTSLLRWRFAGIIHEFYSELTAGILMNENGFGEGYLKSKTSRRFNELKFQNEYENYSTKENNPHLGGYSLLHMFDGLLDLSKQENAVNLSKAAENTANDFASANKINSFGIYDYTLRLIEEYGRISGLDVSKTIKWLKENRPKRINNPYLLIFPKIDEIPENYKPELKKAGHQAESAEVSAAKTKKFGFLGKFFGKPLAIMAVLYVAVSSVMPAFGYNFVNDSVFNVVNKNIQQGRHSAFAPKQDPWGTFYQEEKHKTEVEIVKNFKLLDEKELFGKSEARYYEMMSFAETGEFEKLTDIFNNDKDINYRLFAALQLKSKGRNVNIGQITKDFLELERTNPKRKVSNDFELRSNIAGVYFVLMSAMNGVPGFEEFANNENIYNLINKAVYARIQGGFAAYATQTYKSFTASTAAHELFHDILEQLGFLYPDDLHTIYHEFFGPQGEKIYEFSVSGAKYKLIRISDNKNIKYKAYKPAAKLLNSVQAGLMALESEYGVDIDIRIIPEISLYAVNNNLVDDDFINIAKGTPGFFKVLAQKIEEKYAIKAEDAILIFGNVFADARKDKRGDRFFEKYWNAWKKNQRGTDKALQTGKGAVNETAGGSAPAMILPENMAMVDKMIAEGKSAVRILLKIAGIEFWDSLKDNFAERHFFDRYGNAKNLSEADKDKYRKTAEYMRIGTLAGMFVAGAVSFAFGLPGIFSFELLTIALNLSVAAIGAFAGNAAVHILADYRIVKEKINLAKAEKYAIEKKGGDIVAPVMIVNEEPGNPRDFGFKNTSLKIGGQSVWISSKSKSLVIFAKGASFADIENAAKQENSQIQRQLSEAIKKQTGISLNSSKLAIDWINVDTASDS
ncbi:MAG: trypsin-like peptidase domain-containing protein, partial [Endomicrobia bacterium]|nr:trypsin-like peptidase domain-containing protein [Endomicrobiia bacterium]